MARTADEAETSGVIANIFCPMGWFQKNISKTNIPTWLAATIKTNIIAVNFMGVYSRLDRNVGTGMHSSHCCTASHLDAKFKPLSRSGVQPLRLHPLTSTSTSCQLIAALIIGLDVQRFTPRDFIHSAAKLSCSADPSTFTYYVDLAGKAATTPRLDSSLCG